MRPALEHDVRPVDTTLRDGSYAMAHRFTEQQVRALDRAGVGVIAHEVEVRYLDGLLHAEAAAQRYGVPAQDILRRCGEIGLVGGQEDMIIDVAIRLAAEGRVG